MENTPSNNQENNLDQKIEFEGNLLGKNSEDVSKLIQEKGGTLTEKAKLLKERVGVFLGPFRVFSEKTLLQQQILQQKKVEEYFSKDPTIKVSSFYNRADGSKTFDLKDELQKSGIDENKIILLLNGVVNPPDIVQGLNPNVARLFIAFIRLQIPSLIKYGLDVKKLIKGDSIPDYIINTTKAIKSEIFNEKPVKVIIVRNASSKNLSDVVQSDGENTTLVVGGGMEVLAPCL